MHDINQKEGLPIDGLIEEKEYKGDQSEEFDAFAQRKERTYARMKHQSEATKDKVIISEWHVPCHFILTQTTDGTYQGFHVQPNNPGPTLLSFEQEETLRKLGKMPESRSIVAGSRGSWFNHNDRKELEGFGFVDVREIKVDTGQWWRVLYDPKTNELWIDDKIHHRLSKYRGFPQRNDQQAISTDVTERQKKMKKLLS